ncbi:MAG: thioredoxin domain-containing protein [Verrucomicrobiales bacterium]|nr:thioredoxin domain-containing protein [Verrucomicrobiales bacterium]MCP5527455.1 thioredoxin domain-containing protein [Verrucomicrobiales bacterium]
MIRNEREPAQVNPAAAARQPNRLAREKSPYLLQHQFNPVDWQPWGAAAFRRARDEDKPIFLSIGYSTCHWCHVMERESFEDAAVAELLNRHFVSIKVDREERPDVDQVYMTFVQATTGGGGWPLNVFLTPDLKPFFGGTYFPPEPAPGRASFRQLLAQIQEVWVGRRDEVTRSAARLHEQLLGFVNRGAAADASLRPEWLEHAAAVLQAEYDPRHGGFGQAPKFPRPTQPAFLLRHGHRLGDAGVMAMVAHTCERMAAGGIHDLLGGGFARYSVDERWLVPHFEKMLYDNAQLATLYLETHQATGRAAFAATARATLDYVLADMTDGNGGFYSAEDADSEGKEGKFYCWTLAEFQQLLSPEECAVAVRHFGVTAGGNFVDHSDPDPLPGQNVLHVAEENLEAAEWELLALARARLRAARARRVRPHLDDKILTSWNGLMLGAFARGYAVLGEPRYLAAAEKNLGFIRRALWDEASQTLHHRWREGERDAAQLLPDYAFLLAGVLDLYEATLDPEYLAFGVVLAKTMIERFHDTEHGGFWLSGGPGDDLILRMKDDYDGAEPAGNSVAALSLLRLAAITADSGFRCAAEGVLRLFGDRLERAPQAMPGLLAALDFFLHGGSRVVIVGESSAERDALLRTVHQTFDPNRVVFGDAGPVDPFAQDLEPLGEAAATAYVCTRESCLPPATRPEELRRRLASAGRPADHPGAGRRGSAE